MSWAALLARLESRFPLPMRLELTPRGPDGNAGLIVNWQAEEQATRAAKWFQTATLDVRGIDDERVAFNAARFWMQAAMLHELDECLYVDGKRRWDPHVVQPYPCLHGAWHR